MINTIHQSALVINSKSSIFIELFIQRSKGSMIFRCFLNVINIQSSVSFFKQNRRQNKSPITPLPHLTCSCFFCVLRLSHNCRFVIAFWSVEKGFLRKEKKNLRARSFSKARVHVCMTKSFERKRR